MGINGTPFNPLPQVLVLEWNSPYQNRVDNFKERIKPCWHFLHVESYINNKMKIYIHYNNFVLISHIIPWIKKNQCSDELFILYLLVIKF